MAMPRLSRNPQAGGTGDSQFGSSIDSPVIPALPSVFFLEGNKVNALDLP